MNAPYDKALRLADQRGMTLVSTMMSVGIMGVLAMTTATMFRNAFSSSESLSRRVDREQVRSILLTSLSCSETLRLNRVSGIGSTSRCPSTTAKQVGPYLKLARQTPKGPLWLSAGEPGPNGVRVGDWFVRASCSATEQSLVVRVARAKTDGTCCGKDPLTNQQLDWKHPSSLLFGGVAPAVPLCSGATDGQVQVVERPLADAGSGAGVNCNSSLENALKLYALGAGSPAALLISSKKVYTATMTCPAGKKAVSGGAQCGSGFAFGSGLTAFVTGGKIGGSAPGSLVASQPTPDGSGWSVACCIEGKPKTNSNAYAVCQ